MRFCDTLDFTCYLKLLIFSFSVVLLHIPINTTEMFLTPYVLLDKCEVCPRSLDLAVVERRVLEISLKLENNHMGHLDYAGRIIEVYEKKVKEIDQQIPRSVRLTEHLEYAIANRIERAREIGRNSFLNDPLDKIQDGALGAGLTFLPALDCPIAKIFFELTEAITRFSSNNAFFPVVSKHLTIHSSIYVQFPEMDGKTIKKVINTPLLFEIAKRSRDAIINLKPIGLRLWRILMTKDYDIIALYVGTNDTIDLLRGIGRNILHEDFSQVSDLKALLPYIDLRNLKKYAFFPNILHSTLLYANPKHLLPVDVFRTKKMIDKVNERLQGEAPYYVVFPDIVWETVLNKSMVTVFPEYSIPLLGLDKLHDVFLKNGQALSQSEVKKLLRELIYFVKNSEELKGEILEICLDEFVYWRFNMQYEDFRIKGIREIVQEGIKLLKEKFGVRLGTKLLDRPEVILSEAVGLIKNVGTTTKKMKKLLLVA